MVQKTNILSLTLLILCVIGISTLPCPAPNYLGNIYSAQIIAALDGGIIPISDEQDQQCYNYSLPYAFNTAPDVAISVHSFQAEPSKNLFFFIKPLRSDSLAFVPFVIRTQWPYTLWSQISFSFIAEDRNDIEVGYYQIDSGPLSGCENGKYIDVLLPFRNTFYPGKQIKHSVFLHGFEITTTKIDQNTRSPYQFQIVSSSTNISGISLSISVTTTTKVNSIYISYFAFQKTSLPIVGGSYVFDATTSTNGLYYAPQTTIPRNYARLYGLTGFLLNYNNDVISYNTKWDGFSFSFTLGSDIRQLKYFSFSYVFIAGSQCQDCQGFQIFDNNACVSFCAPGTFKTLDNTCINCGPSRQYNGTACVTICPVGQYLDSNSGVCVCPPTLNWNGQSCIPCFSGRVWDASSKSCQCPKPLIWNGFACAKIEPCVAGRVWDVFTYSCQCPETTYWDGQHCKILPQCTGGQVLNSNYECSCSQGFVWSSNLCIYSPCNGGQIWTGSKCVCPTGLNFNGTMCLECINGQKWDSKVMKCDCQSGYRWNGQFCERSFICSNGRIWNATFQQCICPEGSFWSGYTCLPVQKCLGGQYFDSTIQKCACLSGFNWNGRFCVQCTNGRAWNISTLGCTCPIGTVEVRDGCRFQQVCTGGKQWVQNSWSCECPVSSVWNGNFCIANPCQLGQVWNQSLKSCQCPDNKVFTNKLCVPPQIACTNGRVWNQFIYACACPQGTFATDVKCDTIPLCQYGRVYNPLNNQCQCPFGLSEINSVCTDPKCPVGQFWNGINCQVINCPPPSYFEKDRCVIGGPNQCSFGYQWNGSKCTFAPSVCPSGTTWRSLTCQSNGQCGNGYYGSPSGSCLPLPQQCTPPTTWNDSSCSSSGNICPQGTYAQGNRCFPFQPCKNGFVWDTTYIRCICPPGTINSGNRCVECPNDKKWVPSIGCACPQGAFDTGASCDTPNQSKCSAIANTIWNNNKCLCRPGFTQVGFQCICYGTQVNDFCDKCSYKPNSRLNQVTDTCECRQGWTQINNVCVRRGSQIGNDDPSRCAVGTYFDQNHKSCLACPDGCLSCRDSYKCSLCRPQFIYHPTTQRCFEMCGDGKRFILECDDGNNNDGDGCSRDCKIQAGFTCTGGSTLSKDNCYVFIPEIVTLQQVGQIRRTTSIIINLRLNYLPDSLIQSQDCANQCSQLLTGAITQGDKNVVSITSQYLPGTQYLFTMTVQFGRTFISKFTLNVSLNRNLSKYFGGARIQPIDVAVEPAFLMAVNDREEIRN